jgi:uncharacterized coiled-coil protein SlyX
MSISLKDAIKLSENKINDLESQLAKINEQIETLAGNLVKNANEIEDQLVDINVFYEEAKYKYENNRPVYRHMSKMAKKVIGSELKIDYID